MGAATSQGLGIARTPSYQVVNELESGALVSLLDDYESPSFPVHLIYVRQGLLPLKVRTFIDWITPRLRRALQDIDSIVQQAIVRERSRPPG